MPKRLTAKQKEEIVISFKSGSEIDALLVFWPNHNKTCYHSKDNHENMKLNKDSYQLNYFKNTLLYRT